MFKNLMLLGLLSWISVSEAKGPAIAKENLNESESYKIEEPVSEQKPERSVAGAKKKKGKEVEFHKNENATESDSDVRYWQYSE